MQRKSWVFIGSQVDTDDFDIIDGLRQPGESMSGLIRRALYELAKDQGVTPEKLPKVSRRDLYKK